jgi:hypothetical protein
MKSALLFLVSSIFCTACFSQPSDFIVLKKGQRTIKSFFAGSIIGFVTEKGSYSGKITSVKKDSLFIEEYDIRQIPTNLGVYMLDTVAIYRLGFNYKDVIKIENQKRRGFNWANSGGSLLGGGVLITVVGLGTWIFAKPGTQYHASPALVIGGAALAGIGYLLLKSNSAYYSLGKKYQLEYIKVK